MELLKLDERPAEFKWKDVTIIYRVNVSAEDKFVVDTAGTHINGEKIEFKPWEFYKTMIRVFVIGWRGVTENGKEIPYSYDTFLKRLPGDLQEDLIMQLGHDIAVKNGFLNEKKTEGEAALKNV